ncbi:EamA family transporter [Prolixibacter sp. SD074]|uniref:EamA family transporter n=1 Tax=Prolixibacter sp. SD074 TaxID=2652391 RepID=UPI00129901CB|nr:EamA family transporter [Prolixibacter sp. SD074]
MTPNTTKGVLLAMTTAFLWGFLAIALKVASTMVDSYTIVWFRFTVAFLALFLLLSVPETGNVAHSYQTAFYSGGRSSCPWMELSWVYAGS